MTDLERKRIIRSFYVDEPPTYPRVALAIVAMMTFVVGFGLAWIIHP